MQTAMGQSQGPPQKFYASCSWDYTIKGQRGWHTAVSPVYEYGPGLTYACTDFGRWVVKNHPDIVPECDPDSPRFIGGINNPRTLAAAYTTQGQAEAARQQYVEWRINTTIEDLEWTPPSSPSSGVRAPPRVESSGRSAVSNATSNETPLASHPVTTDGPRLQSTMEFVQNTMSNMGRLDATMYLTNGLGRMSQTAQVFEITYFSADASTCHIAYRLSEPRSGMDSEFAFNLRDVATVTSKTFEQQWLDVAAKSGNNTTATTIPSEFVVDVVLTDSDHDFMYYFVDQDVANQVSAALTRAARLCGAQT